MPQQSDCTTDCKAVPVGPSPTVIFPDCPTTMIINHPANSPLTIGAEALDEVDAPAETPIEEDSGRRAFLAFYAQMPETPHS